MYNPLIEMNNSGRLNIFNVLLDSIHPVNLYSITPKKIIINPNNRLAFIFCLTKEIILSQ
ncbi:hypothetical protein OPHB3_0803 [Oceanobacillus picturae]|uniref:Uncharacterized protein n=1 Tax=Oceanobacillus picturae TaxID=171693 RepID=A0A0U9H346_9BACI|nr:hypothetical protein OPHB3_0803 [Oceanobacillus picturae]